MSISYLRCEYAENPLGVEALQPRLSWRLESAERGQRQTAYQILVSSSEEKLRAGSGDLWDSRKVVSDQSIQVSYQGRRLVSRQRCYWAVRVWDKHGQATSFSEPASWEMGLLSPRDWPARWIGYPAGWNGRALYFRHDVTVQKVVQKARVYIAESAATSCA